MGPGVPSGALDISSPVRTLLVPFAVSRDHMFCQKNLPTTSQRCAYPRSDLKAAPEY